MVKRNVDQQKIFGLTLSGGGARGAYQAGVLRAIYEITEFQESPFKVISGVSAGALNAVALAEQSQDFGRATKKITDTWLDLSMDKIFKTDSLTGLTMALKWIADLALGEYLPTQKVTHFLNTEPLRALLQKNLDFSKVADNIISGNLHGIALSATDYRSGKSVTFFDGAQSIEEWDRYSGSGKRSRIDINHMMASSAIPIFFPPVRIDQSDYGDGGIGQSAPMSPALRLGSDKVLAIGLEHPPGNRESEAVKSIAPLTLSDIAGTLLSSLFIKSMRGDIIRMTQTNKLLSFLSPEEIKTGGFDLRQVPALFITPSKDLGKIDVDQFEKFPFALRRLLKSLGFTNSTAWDLLSYLAFEEDYAKALLDLGYADALAQEDGILKFFEIV
ncbi:MAG: patatin-like phospholipase family protein [Proteobacteria bacterium]|nr:MAG: patatin-like phospholipase family protein [Pseudomonadota bacterium]